MADGHRIVRQERQATNQKLLAIQHRDDTDFIINILSFHNHSILVETLPSGLAPAPLLPHDRVSLRHDAAQKARSKKDAKKDAKKNPLEENNEALEGVPSVTDHSHEGGEGSIANPDGRKWRKVQKSGDQNKEESHIRAAEKKRELEATAQNARIEKARELRTKFNI
jgi:hypothetical protein